jgi:hypothetical protein
LKGVIGDYKGDRTDHAPKGRKTPASKAKAKR